MDTLGRELEELRASLFVGREAELALLEELLADAPPTRIVYVHGIGGMGKSELLRAFARRARDRGWQVRLVDARELPHSAEALRIALVPTAPDSERTLVLIDTFEVLSAVEKTFRERALPLLPDETRLVFAGRTELSPAWNEDPRWSGLLRVLALDELSSADAREYLRKRGVDRTHARSILELAGGFPLGLALAAEAHREVSDGAASGIADDSSLVDAMLRSIVDHPPSRDHYRTLMLSALAFRTTAQMVSHIVDDREGPELFRWLASRSYMRRDGNSVSPHDLVRKALLTNLHWRDPNLVSELVVSVARYYLDVVRGQRSAVFEGVRDASFLFVHAGGTPFLADGFYRARPTELRPGDWTSIEELVAKQTGPQALEHVRRWRDHSAFEFYAVRRGEGPMIGFFSFVRANKLTPAERSEVPGLAEFCSHMAPVEGPVYYAWLWGDARAGQHISETQSCVQWFVFQTLFDDPPPVVTGFLVRADMRWPHEGTQKTKPKVIAETSFILDGTRFVSLGKAHSEVPGEWHWQMFEEWFEMLTASDPGQAAGPPIPAAGAVFDWLKQALKNADRPDRLGESPLLELQVVKARNKGTAGRIDQARSAVELLRELSEMFLETPRDEVYFEVLRRTYFEPAVKQRVVADDLHLAFSTYRRYLATAIERLTDAIMQHELAALMQAQGE